MFGIIFDYYNWTGRRGCYWQLVGMLQEKGGVREWSCPRSLASSRDGPPSERPWLHTEKNSRAASQSKMKASLYGEIHIPQAELGPSQR